MPSERYIPPTDEELTRIIAVEKASKRFEEQRTELLRTALSQLEKDDLVELAVRAAQEEKAVQWLLEEQTRLEKPVELLVHTIEDAIKIATRVNEHELNRNSHYDWRAYKAAESGLTQLIEKQAIEEAKALALTLIERGGHQINCSDEGMMREEIEDCLRPVIAAVAFSPGASDWARDMLTRDTSGFICEGELRELAGVN